MRFRAPIIPHAIAVMVLDLEFYTKDPDGMGDAVNIFLFPDLTPAAESKASLLAHRWEAILEGEAITPFADTRSVPQKNVTKTDIY